MIFSIITATYNREDTIARSIESIKSQSYSKIQHIVIDGKSKDDSISIIKSLLDDDDIFVSEPDYGIYDALNKGLKHASGEIIGFLHSDDLYYDSHVLEKVAKAFLDDDIDVVYGDVGFFEEENINFIKRFYKSDKLSRKNLAWGKMPAHPAIFIKRSLYKKIGFFNNNFKIAGDYELLCRLVLHPNLKCKYIAEIFVKMQLGGISTRGIRSTIMLNKEILKAIRMNGIYTNIFMILSKYPSKIMQYIKKK